GGFLQCVEDLVADAEAALADGGITRGLGGLEAVDQHVVEARGAAAVVELVPAHETGRRAHTVAVGRSTGDVAGELAAALDHDAQAAEGEYFDRHRRALAQALHLLD